MHRLYTPDSPLSPQSHPLAAVSTHTLAIHSSFSLLITFSSLSLSSSLLVPPPRVSGMGQAERTAQAAVQDVGLGGSTGRNTCSGVVRRAETEPERQQARCIWHSLRQRPTFPSVRVPTVHACKYALTRATCPAGAGFTVHTGSSECTGFCLAVVGSNVGVPCSVFLPVFPSFLGIGRARTLVFTAPGCQESSPRAQSFVLQGGALEKLKLCL